MMAVIWIGSQTPAQVDQSFMKLAVKFNLPMHEMSKDSYAMKLRIRTWLEKTGPNQQRGPYWDFVPRNVGS